MLLIRRWFFAKRVIQPSPLQSGQPICSGTAYMGDHENTVMIYGVRKQNNQTQYRAGYPFNWRWVSANTFTSTTCK
ncbi:phage exclusion lipoprotein Cor [Enterobacter bugandensis]|uniref:phage exclusion lipoprotein Cor n=1 Tax=Enterobacter bugandensis TaxID=881260 RepID=UPI0022E14F16|nr:cor protein [Enterobacter bugandensis]